MDDPTHARIPAVSRGRAIALLTGAAAILGALPLAPAVVSFLAAVAGAFGWCAWLERRDRIRNS